MHKTRVINLISAEAAMDLALNAIEAGKARSVPVSVSVVDALANEVVFAKADGATVHSAFTSRRKACTSASTKRATGWMNAELAVTLPMASDNFLTNVGGGLPITQDGAVVGAIGIAGGTVDQDIEIAHCALQSVALETAA